MTEHIDNGGPAYPTAEQNYETKYASEGMTLRQYYAAHAPDEPEWFGEYLFRRATYVDGVVQLAMWRFHYADAMLAAEKLA